MTPPTIAPIGTGFGSWVGVGVGIGVELELEEDDDIVVVVEVCREVLDVDVEAEYVGTVICI